MHRGSDGALVAAVDAVGPWAPLMQVSQRALSDRGASDLHRCIAGPCPALGHRGHVRLGEHVMQGLP